MPQSKTLFSTHYLEKRLPQHAEWQAEVAADFEAVRALWERAQAYGASWDEAQTEEEFIKPMLEVLGWHAIVQPKATHAGRRRRPDYALFPDAATRDAAYPHQGEDDAFYAPALAIGEAKYWQRPLSKRDEAGREAWDRSTNPSYQIVSYLVGTGVAWGILTNGRIWRLYSREVSSTASEFYEIDLGEIFASPYPSPSDGEGKGERGGWGEAAFKKFWLFFRRAAFIPDAQGRSFVQRVHEGSATYAREISDKLKELVYAEVMPEIAGGFIAYRREQRGIEQETEESLAQIYQASLSLLYKLLFLLYAEARGLLPVDNAGYREQSLTRLAQWAAQRLDAGAPLSNATFATPRYDALLALFHRVDQGDPDLGVPRYDGGLFNPQNPDNRFLEQHRLSDRAVARTVDILVRDAGEPVDYAYISVRNLGAIYEGLLEFKLDIEESKLEDGSWKGDHGVQSPISNLQLVNDKGERKATGSYYTPDYIVAYIVEHTLGPIVAARAEEFAAGMDRVAHLRRELQKTARPADVRWLRRDLESAEREAREAFLGIKVCDPAMGSGHFLVNAVDFLTDQVIRRMQAYHDAPGNEKVSWEWNPIQRLIDEVRADVLAAMAEQGIALDPARLDDTALLTRLVMKRCIYGVDLNPMAVELAKLSLWLHSFTVGAPLSFLDHHLRCGNSLIGADVRTVEAAMGAEASGQIVLFQGPFAGLLDLTKTMVEVVHQADATLSDVQRSAETFATLQRTLTPYKQALDLWVSRHFGNARAEEFLRLFDADVLPALRGEREIAPEHQAAIERARELWEEKRFFHWDLEFPEIFVDLERRDWKEDPGFDAVIGNPPWASVRGKHGSGIFDEFEVAYFETEYPENTYMPNAYEFFVARALKILSCSGWHSFIVPDRLGFNASLTYLRERLLNQYTLHKLIYKVPFPEVIADTLIYVVEAKRPNESHKIEVVDYGKDAVRVPISFYGGVGDKVFLFFRSKAVLDSLRAIEGNFTIPIEDVAKTTSGFGGMSSKITNRRVDSQQIPVIKGADVGEYALLDLHYFVFRDEYLTGRTRDETKLGYKPKILLRKTGYSIPAAFEGEGVYPEQSVYFLYDFKQCYSPLYLLVLLNSRVFQFYYIERMVTNRDSTPQLKKIHLDRYPIPRIHFTTPEAERRRLRASLIAHYEAREHQTLLQEIAACLPATPPSGSPRAGGRDAAGEKSDVVHDLLAYLAEQMIDLHRRRQRLEKALDPFKFLDRGARFVKFRDAFAEAIKYGAQLPPPDPALDLDAAHHDIDGLRLARADEGAGWRLDVQCKLRDPADEWRSWQYADEGHYIAREWVAVYRFPPDALDERRARYYQHAFAALDEFANAKSFPGGRTRTTRQKLRLARVPAFDAAADLAPLIDLSAELAAVRARIAETDALIDQIVYRLYGLTAEEIAVVAR